MEAAFDKEVIHDDVVDSADNDDSPLVDFRGEVREGEVMVKVALVVSQCPPAAQDCEIERCGSW